MITWIVRRVEAALNYEPGEGIVYRAHAGLKIIALIITWIIALAPGGIMPATLSLVYPLVLHLLAGWRKALYAFQASIIASLIIGFAALILTPYKPLTIPWAIRGGTLLLRVYSLASGTLLTFSTTPPSKLLSLLARKTPLLHDVLLLSYRLSPQVAGDMAEAYAVQRLLGKGLRDPLVGTVLSELYRARMIEISLYSRGIVPGKPRTPLETPGEKLPGVILVLLSGITLIVYIILYS